MKQIIVHVSEHALKMFNGDEALFAREMYETAVVKWFDEALISQGRAAEMLGIARVELFDLLKKHNVFPIQITPEELAEECRNSKA